jgi:hypothetical protein
LFKKDAQLVCVLLVNAFVIYHIEVHRIILSSIQLEFTLTSYYGYCPWCQHKREFLYPGKGSRILASSRMCSHISPM